MKYIIMCGGIYAQWDKPRPLLEIHGEKIIERTIRLLKENGVYEIYISSNYPEFASFAPVFKHDNTFKSNGIEYSDNWVDAFYPMDEPCCYIFGDVVFSPEAIKTIVETETDDIEFFGSAPPFAPDYIKPWAEPFALKVVNQNHFKEAIKETKRLSEEGMFHRKPIMWELWQVITGSLLNFIDCDSYFIINDYTCDIDNPEDLAKIEEKMPYETSMEVIG